MTRTQTTTVRSRRDPDPCPALPSRWPRDAFIHLVERVAPHLGLGRAATHSWSRLAVMTRPADWTADDREPSVYAPASEVAKMLGLSPARLRAHTAELERAGLIERRIAANGSRSRCAGTGLFFSGIIGRLQELADLDAQLTAARHTAMHLRGQCSTHRRCLRQALAQLRGIAPDHPRVQSIADELAAWPRADKLHAMALAPLIQHEARADALVRKALDLLELLAGADDQPPESERSPLQDTTEDISLFCDAGTENRRPVVEPALHRGLGETTSRTSAHAKPKGGSSLDFFKSEWITKLSPERLFRLASPEMRFYLSGRAVPERLRFHDFAWTAQRRLAELDIHPSAWREACIAMGEDSATLAVLILDARRSDPALPILSPGGYLRGMTRAWLQGQLNLTGSLIALNERRRREQAP